MTPKRLFVLRPNLGQGGADRVTLTLLEHLDRRRFQPTLVLLQRSGVLLPALPEDVEVLDLGARNLFAGARPLARLLRREAPDILFSTSSGTNVTAALAAALVRAPGRPRLVLSERNGLVRDQPRYKLWPLLLAKRRLYPRADCVTAVSGGVAEDLRRRLGVERVVTVHNPVLTPELERRISAAAPPPWSPSARPVLVAAGRLVPAKGFDLLLDAFARLRREIDCRLVVLGEGPLRGPLEAQAQRLAVDEDVEMPGFVEDPYAFMRHAAAFVLPSRFEGLPGVLIQAMACGAPVVAADCPFGPAEIVTDGESGMLVPVNDVGALEAALRRLLEEPTRASTLAAAGRRAVDRFRLEAVLPHYERALDPETG